MWFIPWIQTSSAFIKNSKWPADWKMSLSTADRLALTFVQRKKGMLCYDEDSDTWKILVNDPSWDTTSEADWKDLWSELMPETEENAVAKFQVTQPFEANEVIDLIAGTGSVNGSCVVLWDTIDSDFNLWSNAWEFFNNRWINVYLLWQWQQYKWISANREANDSLSFPVPLNIWDFFRVEKDAWMGMAGWTWANAIEYTYAELVALRDAHWLTPWNRYKMTDYQSSWLIPWTTDVFVWPTEEIVLEATSDSSFRRVAISPTHSNDELQYDIDDNAITSDNTVYASVDTGATDWDFIINITWPRQFTVDVEPVANNNIYIYWEDNNSDWFDLWINDYGVLRTYTDLWWGLWQIDLDSSVVIDLTTPSYNYVEMETSQKYGNRTWKILKRTYLPTNVSYPWDFRVKWLRLYKLDTTWNLFNASTTYSEDDLVVYNDTLYLSLQDNNMWHTPQFGADKYWWPIIRDVASGNEYKFTYDWLYLFGNNIPADLTNYIQVSPFTIGESWVYTEQSPSNFNNITCSVNYKDVPNIIFVWYSSNTYTSFDINAESYNLLFLWEVNRCLLWIAYNCIFTSTLKDTSISSMYYSVLWYMSNVKISSNTQSCVFFGWCWDNTFTGPMQRVYVWGSFYGNNIYQLYNWKVSSIMRENTIKQYSYNCYFLWESFYKNIVISMNNIVYSYNGNWFHDNDIWIDFSYNLLNWYVRENKVWNFCKYNNFTSHFHMNKIGNNFWWPSNSNKNVLGNVYRNIIWDYFWRFWACSLQSMDNNDISNDQRNWSVSNNTSNNIIRTSVQDLTIARVFANNKIFGTFVNINLTGHCQSNVVTGHLSSLTWDTFSDNSVDGTLDSCTFTDIVSACNFMKGRSSSGNDFWIGFSENDVVGVINCTFNQTAWVGTIHNKIYSCENIDFTSATHVTEDYNCIIQKNSANWYSLRYIDWTNTEQIVSANA